MLATLIPLYDSSSEVCAYSLFVQKENKLLSANTSSASAFDGVVNVLGMDMINTIGLEVLSGDRMLFLEINKVSIFSNVENECTVEPHNVAFIIDPKIKPEEKIINRIKDLKAKGFGFAIRKLKANQFAEHAPIIALMDYILFNHKKINVSNLKQTIKVAYPNAKLIAVSVDSKEDYDALLKEGVFDLYEGEYFRLPMKHAGEELSPLKVTYLELLKLVNIPDFDLTTVADIVGHDTALVIRLLEMANKFSVNNEITSIRQATAMIGQNELKKWINSAITKELCADRPSEITRISLIRAKFAENLAPFFNLAILSNELFLMGLFSVLDVILNKPIEEALDMVVVSKQIQDALIRGEGNMAPVYSFILAYEDANWEEVSRRIIVDGLDMDMVYSAYVDALSWFTEMFR